MSSLSLSNSKVSRRAFVLGGAGFVGSTALPYGCGSIGDKTNFGIGAPTEKNKELPPSGAVREIALEARPAEIEIASGQRVNTWTYDGKFPGTEIRAKEGERLRIMLKNSLPEDTSIHWHGIQQKGTSNMDGIPGLTQPPIPAGASFVYDFVANAPGTYFYHPHSGLHIERGLSAPLIVEPKKETIAYDREYTLVLDDWLDGSPDLAFEQLKQGVSPANGPPKAPTSSSSSHEGEMMEMGHSGMSESESCCANGDVAYSTYLIGAPRKPLPSFRSSVASASDFG